MALETVEEQTHYYWLVLRDSLPLTFFITSTPSLKFPVRIILIPFKHSS
mgnify:CR=1 FL=1